MLDAKALEASRAAYQSAIPDGAWHANGGETDAPIRAAITAYLQAVGPEPAVAVRPLEWNERGYAHTGNGTLYWVTRQTDCWVLDKITGSSHFKSSYPSEETAKANAEADYASRIRSALVATPPAEPVAFRVHDFHIARSPVKARGLFPEVTEYLYPANREQDAKDIARALGGEFQPLYAPPTSTPPAERVVEALLSWVCEDVLPAYGVSGEIARNDPELAESCRAALAAKDGRS